MNLYEKFWELTLHIFFHKTFFLYLVVIILWYNDNTLVTGL